MFSDCVFGYNTQRIFFSLKAVYFRVDFFFLETEVQLQLEVVFLTTLSLFLFIGYI